MLKKAMERPVRIRQKKIIFADMKYYMVCKNRKTMRKKAKGFFKALCAGILICAMSGISAQKTQTFQQPETICKSAKELFDMQQYGAAKEAFLKIMESTPDKHNPKREEALYYAAVCACRLHHKDAGLLCREFTESYPESIYLGRLHWNLANYRFNSSAYHLAMLSYEKADEGIMDADSRLEYLFKKGYCHFYENNYDEAKPLFAEVKENECPYTNKALFYYSHILYTERNYRSALEGFEKLKDIESYSSIVPFYIAQIRYAMGDYGKITAEAASLLEKSTDKRAPEINRIIAQSYFSMEKYREAIPYMKEYLSKVEMATCEDYYTLGYCHYREKNYDEAVRCLTRAICRNQDSLNQQVYFVIGDCYLQTGQKEFAANTFYAAYELKKDPYLTEDALFTYAKLQYELSANPFSNAISALEKYVNEYPQASRRTEAEQYLSDIYLTTKNYQAAINSLEKISHRSSRLNEAYQRVLCFKGMELYNDGKYEEARKYLSKSMANNYRSETYAQSLFWMAESFYREGNYTAATDGYNRFLASEGAPRTAEYGIAHYNAGYASFKERQFSHALDKFQIFESRKGYAGNPRLEADMYNRMGDCCYMLSELDKARRYYGKAVALDSYDADYALFQQAAVMGGSNKPDAKIELLTQLREKYPNSTYVSDALLETADTYLSKGSPEKAAEHYTEYIRKYPNNQRTKEVMLNLGLVYFNAEDDENALRIFKRIVQDYPRTKESATALKNIENIYSISGNVEEFFAYVRDISYANITPEAQDSITYNSAADKYYNKQFPEAEKGFDTYIAKFPEGVFATHAHFYRAECRMRRNHSNEALSDYEYVMAHPLEQFEIPALLNAADIHYKNRNYRSAITCYQKLQEMDLLPSGKETTVLGLMRAYYADSNFNSATIMAKTLLGLEKISNEMREEAHAVIARSAVSTKDWAVATQEFEWLGKNSKSEYASEALYMLAYIEYMQGNLDAAEKKVFEVLVNIAYEYWSVKSYILLGDIYEEKGNTFQAKHTFLSIIDNYDGEELRTVALNKYNSLLAKEEAASKQQQQRQEELEKQNDNLELGN